MSGLEYAVRQFCKSKLTESDILEYTSHTIAYSILSDKSLEESKTVIPEDILPEAQLDDLLEISLIVNRIKRDIYDYGKIV